MGEYTFDLQVVTPLFSSGYNRRAVEIRPPSVRGALRFWFRAMMSGVTGADVADVNALEAGVFGNTSYASKARIRVAYPQRLNPSPFNANAKGVTACN